MKSNTKIHTGFVAGVILLPVLAFFLLNFIQSKSSVLPYYGKNYTHVSKENGFKVSGFDFTNQHGEKLTDEFVKGKVWVACYFFTTCPIICPKMISGMGDVQKKFLGEDRLRLVSFTVDPLKDTPEVLKHYAEVRNIDTKQWKFLTGEKKDLYRYARKGLTLMATDGDGGPQDFIHSDRLVLIDSENYIRGYYDGTEPTEVKQLIEDIKKLL